MVGEDSLLVLCRQMFNLSREVVPRKSYLVDAGMVGELMAQLSSRHLQRETVNRCQEVLPERRSLYWVPRESWHPRSAGIKQVR